MDLKGNEKLWGQARKLLRQELGDDEWLIFVSQQNSGSPKDTLKSLEREQECAQNEYATHTLKIKDKKIFDFNVGRIMKRFTILCQMVDSTMCYAPESASVVWTAFRMLTRFFLLDQELCEFLTGALDRMSDVIFVCDIYAHKFYKATGATRDKILETIPQLYKQVLLFSFETKKLFPHDDKKRFTDKIIRGLSATFGKTGALRGIVDDTKDQIERLREMTDIDFKTVVEETVKETFQKVNEIGQDLKEIKDLNQLFQSEMASELRNVSLELSKSREEADRKKLEEECNKRLAWLQSGTTLNLQQPQDQHNENLKKRSPGTCQWIFERESYKTWLNAQETRVLWLSGPAGAGKSFLSSSVIDSVDTTDASGERPFVVYFFCKVGNDAKQKSEKIMIHLLLQLFKKINDLKSTNKLTSAEVRNIKSNCVEVIREKAKVKNSERADRLKVSTMANMFASIAEELGRRVFIVLDALDECDDWEERGLLKSLANLPKEDANICLFVSSRADSDIQAAFSNTEDSIQAYRIEVDKSANEADIAKYVEHQLGLTKSGEKRFKHVPKEDKKRARKVILEKSEGMFQYAVMAVKSLDNGQALANFRKAINQLPNGMNELYAQQFQALEQKSREVLRIMLRWLVCAEGSITAAPVKDEIGETYGSQVEEDDGIQDDDTDFADESSLSSDEEDEKAIEENTKDEVVSTMKLLVRDLREFVKFDTSTTVISLHHKSIKDWIVKDARHAKTLRTDCPVCRERELANTASTRHIAPKYGHLHMASKIMRTLNDPEFQRRYIVINDEKETDEDHEKKDDGPAEAAQSQERVSEENKDSVGVVEAGATPAQNAENSRHESKDVESEPQDRSADLKGADNKEIQQEEGDVRDFGSNETTQGVVTATDDAGNTDQRPELHRIDTEQLYQDNLTDEAGSERGEDFSFPAESQGKETRYEMSHWFYHVRLAEQEWPEEERESSEMKEQWEQLYQDIEKFMRSDAFKSWEHCMYGHEAAPRKPLYYAARFGLLGTLQRLVDAGEDLSEADENGNSPLHVLCLGIGGFIGLDFILEKDSSQINCQGKTYAETPLLMLLCYRYNGAKVTLDHVRSLLDHGARPEIPDKFQYTCLHYAVAAGDLEICKLLLSHDEVKVNVQDGIGETPLHWLLKSRNASIEIAQLLIDCGADVRIEDKDSQAPLFEAARTGNHEIGRLLLKHGADVNDGETVWGSTALHEAVIDGNLDFVKLLVEYGADMLAQNNQKKTPISLAASAGSEDILHWLLQQQRSRSNNMECLVQKDINGQTALHRSAARGHLGCVKLLLEFGQPDVSCTQRNIHGATPLHSAARRGHEEIVKILLESGSDLDARDKADNTPLRLATERWKTLWGESSQKVQDTISYIVSQKPEAAQNTELLNLAIERGVDSICKHLSGLTNEVDNHGWTPLLLAVAQGEQHIVDILSPFDTSGILGRLSNVREGGIGNAPTAWSTTDKSSWLALSEDGLTVFGTEGNGDEWKRASIRANHPIPVRKQHYYYEITVEDIEEKLPYNILGLGFCSQFALLWAMPGWETAAFPTWGYHGDDGCKFQYCDHNLNYPEDHRYGPEFKRGDTIGAGIDFSRDEAVIFFTSNGQKLGDAFRGEHIKGRLFPVVGLIPEKVKVRANFGAEPFHYEWKY